MTKMEKLQKKIDEARSTRSRLGSEINDLKKKRPALAVEATTMAEAGDVDGYLRMKQEADRVDAQLYVTELQLKKTEHPIDEAEAREAWSEYIRREDALFEKRYSEYLKARQELCVQLKDILFALKKSDDLRRMLATFFEHTSDSSNAHFATAQSFVMKTLTPKDVQNDVTFFGRAGELTFDEVNRLGAQLMSNV